MGGTIKSVGKAVSKAVSNPIRAATAVMTFGTSELARKTPIGNSLLSMPEKMLGFGRNPSEASIPTADGAKISPLDLLSQTGGGPVLSSVALGVNPQDAVASYFGVRPEEFDKWMGTLDQKERSGIGSVVGLLNQVQSNTDLRNQAVTKLTTDFPNFMESQIPRYSHLMDDVTKNMVNTALSQNAAKYAAGGQLSSGAATEAAARVGQEAASKNFEFGANLALQDWTNKFNTATALQSFQQKMMGNSQQQGFNSWQNALQNNLNVTLSNQKAAADQASLEQQNQMNQTNALYGGLGALGAGLLGPSVAAAGTGIATQLFGKTPRLNTSNNTQLPKQ